MAQSDYTFKEIKLSKLVGLSGDKELYKELGKLEHKIRLKILKPAIRTGLEAIKKHAKSLTPVEDGFLREEIKKAVDRRGKWGKIYIDNGSYDTGKTRTSTRKTLFGKRKTTGAFKKKPINYAHLVEFGTKNTSPQPFMRPAREAKQGEALQRMANSARKKLSLPKL